MVDAYAGEIRIMAGFLNNSPPTGWLVCDGRLISVNEYQVLFALIGTIYGGNGTTNFALPDLRGRLPIDNGQGPGLTNRIIGTNGGTEGVTLTVANLPAHNHSFNATSATATSNLPTGATLATLASPWVQYTPPTAQVQPLPFAANELQSAGNGQPHDNVMPGVVMNYIICTNGLYPTP